MTRTTARPRYLQLAWSGLILAVVATLALWITGDVWWPVFPLLFGPRWIVLPLLLFPIPLMFTAPRRGILIFTTTVLVVFVGILGWRYGVARLRPDAPTAQQIRVVQYNVAANGQVAQKIADSLSALHADIALLEECPSIATPPHAPSGWTLLSAGELCVLSRLPVVAWQVMPQDTIWKIRGKAAVGVVTVLVVGRPVAIGLLHLKSPRDALLDLAHPRSYPAILRGAVDSVSHIRMVESGIANAFFASLVNAPMIVAGDFNTPVESRVWRRWWSGYGDAFAMAGMGLGYSWHSRWHGVRIDHIITTGSARAVRCWIGPDLGSDHVPVIADIVIDPAH